jgi:hypothetical protein
MNGLAFLTSTLLVAWNPIAPPEIPKPPQEQVRVVTPVIVKHGAIPGAGANVVAKIIIPRGLVHAWGGGGAAPPKAGSPPPAAEKQSNIPPLGTVIAGLAMSLAAASMVFIARGNRSGRTVALAVLAGAMILAAYGVASADIPVPGRGPRPEPPREIVIELADGGDTVTLLLAK